MAGLGALFRTLAGVLPPQVMAVVAVVLLAAFLPSFFENVREKQIRGAVRRMVRADESQRDALAHEALQMAAERGPRLALVAQEANRYGQKPLRERALAALAAIDAAEAERIRALLAPEAPKVTLHPLEVVVRVERLLEEGMVEAAQARVSEALARSPDDPELLALSAKVQAARDTAQA